MTLGIDLAKITALPNDRLIMIQWYPGHMYKASKEFRKILPQVDLVIEVLDARLPGSSANPLLAELRRDKPCIKLLNKSDLADSARLADWIVSLEQQNQVKTLVCSSNDNVIAELPALCRELMPVRDNRSTMIYAMIAGIPNVGKSTLINRLAERKIARTGNEAALTRMQQRIEISSALTLIDTPGMLWPNIENEASGYRLAASGAIRDTALNLQDVASFVAEFLLESYPERLLQRYDIEPLPSTEIEVLEAIARKRGCIVAGGQVDLEKVSRLLITELRSGELGPLCMETPSQLAAEWERVEMTRIEKAAKKEARKAKRQKR
jgi:ribosome biogenesis GTPase A